jgi:GIY-YIG catalytic domain-containing protein
MARASPPKRWSVVLRSTPIDRLTSRFEEANRSHFNAEMENGMNDQRSQLAAKVDEYCLSYGLKNVIVSPVYDIDRDWNQVLPNAGKAGIYCFYAEDGHLLYVGKASLSTNLGKRIMSWFKHNPTGTGHYAIGDWPDQPKTLITVGVERAHEAPSLEEFLIEQLNPSANVRRVAPYRPAVPD